MAAAESTMKSGAFRLTALTSFPEHHPVHLRPGPESQGAHSHEAVNARLLADSIIGSPGSLCCVWVAGTHSALWGSECCCCCHERCHRNRLSPWQLPAGAREQAACSQQATPHWSALGSAASAVCALTFGAGQVPGSVTAVTRAATAPGAGDKGQIACQCDGGTVGRGPLHIHMMLSQALGTDWPIPQTPLLRSVELCLLSGGELRPSLLTPFSLKSPSSCMSMLSCSLS